MEVFAAKLESALSNLPLVFCAPARAGLLMFVVSDSAAAAVRTAMDQSGDLGATAELHRLYPGIRDFAHAQQCARIIAGWAAADKSLALAAGEHKKPGLGGDVTM
jgi:hypothetical protein